MPFFSFLLELPFGQFNYPIPHTHVSMKKKIQNILALRTVLPVKLNERHVCSFFYNFASETPTEFIFFTVGRLCLCDFVECIKLSNSQFGLI